MSLKGWPHKGAKANTSAVPHFLICESLILFAGTKDFMKERSYYWRWNKCLRRDYFPQPLCSRWPGVTLTMHTMLVDEKPVDLCPLFMDAHNSKVPLSALLNAGALTFYARSSTILWCCCKMALHCYAEGDLGIGTPACGLKNWRSCL